MLPRWRQNYDGGSSAVPLTAAAIMPSDNPFLEFIRRTANDLRKDDRPPKSLEEWARWRTALRKNLLAAWGGFPDQPASLEAKTLGEIKCDGYRIEKILFQTRLEVWMPANLYLPDGAG